MRAPPLSLAVVVLAVLGLAGPGVAAADVHYKVIVHPKNPIASIDRATLRNAYLKKASDWGHGETIRPVDLSTKLAVRQQFTREVLKKTPEQLTRYWNQQIFSGKGVPPPQVDTAAAVIAYVLANPGAVGYLPAELDPGGAKVIEVR